MVNVSVVRPAASTRYIARPGQMASLAHILIGAKACRRSTSSDGFALLVVIGAIGILAYTSAIFVALTRAQIRVASASRESARAEGLADAGINLAALKIIRSRSRASSGKPDLEEWQWRCRSGEDQLVVQVQDEAGKIDLNFANERLLRALLAGLQVAPDAVVPLAQAIMDFRDRDDDKRASGAEKAEYLVAGRARGPKNAPFAVVQELYQVLGLESEVVDKMLPYVTAHSGKDGIDPEAASRDLIELIRNGDRDFHRTDLGDEIDFAPEFTGLPDHFATRSGRTVFTVRTEALMANGVRFAREAIVDVSPPHESEAGRAASAYRLWRWRRVGSNSDGTRPGSLQADVPPC
jgi:general secretion pathway protein K